MQMILLTLMALSTPAAAVQPATSVIKAQSLGMELAQTLTNFDRQRSQINNLLEGTYAAIVASNADVKAMQAQYPDMQNVWIQAMLPITIEEMKKHMPGYFSELAALFDASFTNTELRQLTGFWKSPTGQNLLDRINANATYKNVSSEIAADLESETDVSNAAIARDKNDAVKRAVDKLTKSDLEAIARFGMSASGKKFVAIRPKKDAIDAKWFNIAPSKESLARIDNEVPAAMDAYMAKVDAAMAKVDAAAEKAKAEKPISHRP
jgi:hypothetical protein